MKLNAQNTLEIITLIVVVVVIAVASFLYLGKKNSNLNEMTKIKLNYATEIEQLKLL